MNFSQTSIETAVQDISEMINSASFGMVSWEEIPKAMTALFPGSFSSIQNHDVINDQFPFAVADGLDADHILTYAEHFHAISPYEKHWMAHRDGHVWISDKVISLHELELTEFYNDWMKTAGDFDSAIGVRLVPDACVELRFNLHFPTRFLDLYEKPASAIINRLRTPLHSAISLSRHLDRRQERAARLAAMVSRNNKVAFVVDWQGQLREANRPFELLMQQGGPFALSQRRVTLRDVKQSACFAALVRKVSSSANHPAHRMVIHDQARDWVLSFSRLPTGRPCGLILQQPQVLVVATPLGLTHQAEDLTEFARAYQLTMAEQRLCQALRQTQSLTDAALICKISYETSRTRIKTIFQKTDTTSQIALLLRLEQFCNA
ncbi:hypothetical protein [uncultured Cohaesibacter sp.]|uniref:helix-turn-helix transcriptional regulator n=1 Tax=uncultured Cohaesibacter sp. TaxID=1002546 RepID=UPI0029C6508D|nr:hypothetical protein [uncultured Cohaesibacter sp.]